MCVCVSFCFRAGVGREGGGVRGGGEASMRLACSASLFGPRRGGLQDRGKQHGFRCLYQEPRQLQIQNCIPKASCLDRDDDGEDEDADDDDDDDDAIAGDHDVDAPDYEDVGKYDEYDASDVDVVACSCRG